MNGIDLIMKLQQKMQNPVFANKFNKLVNDINSIPGLQEEVMRISQINDEKERSSAIEKLPSKVKRVVSEMIKLIND